MRNTRRLIFHPALVLFALLWPAIAWAHHDPDHRVVAAGVPTNLAFEFPVCDTEKQLVEIVASHAMHGFDAARVLFNRFGQERNEKGEPMCGMATVPIVIDSVVAEAIDLDYPSGKGTVVIVRLHVHQHPDNRGVAALPNVKVLPAEKAYLLDVFASI